MVVLFGVGLEQPTMLKWCVIRCHSGKITQAGAIIICLFLENMGPFCAHSRYVERDKGLGFSQNLSLSLSIYIYLFIYLYTQMYAHTLSLNMCSPSRAGKPGILLIGWLMVGFLVLADKKNPKCS